MLSVEWPVIHWPGIRSANDASCAVSHVTCLTSNKDQMRCDVGQHLHVLALICSSGTSSCCVAVAIRWVWACMLALHVLIRAFTSLPAKHSWWLKYTETPSTVGQTQVSQRPSLPDRFMVRKQRQVGFSKEDLTLKIVNKRQFAAKLHHITRMAAEQVMWLWYKGWGGSRISVLEMIKCACDSLRIKQKWMNGPLRSTMRCPHTESIWMHSTMPSIDKWKWQR